MITLLHGLLRCVCIAPLPATWRVCHVTAVRADIWVVVRDPDRSPFMVYERDRNLWPPARKPACDKKVRQ